jgi:hypothetical protein
MPKLGCSRHSGRYWKLEHGDQAIPGRVGRDGDPHTMSSRCRLRPAVLLTALVVALTGLGSIPRTTAQARVSAPNDWTSDQLQAARTLVSHAPAAFRAHCTLRDPNTPGTPDGLVADVDCNSPDPAISSVSYEQFSSGDAMQAEYTAVVERDGSDPTPRDGCEAERKYTIGGETTGTVVCLPTEYETDIVYTYAPLLVVGEIVQNTDIANGPDIAALNRFSDQSAGPDSASGEIPSLLSDAAAARAVADLRSHLPAAIRKHCVSEEVLTKPWLAASLRCEHPYPGVWEATFEAYRDHDGFAANFDPAAAAKSSERRNAQCPNTGTWSSGGHVRGHFGCWVDADGTYLLWSLDQRRIVAYAYTNGGRLTSKQFLAWWDQRATLTP